MSRRKQSNPKPLLKSECQETTEEMTIERDNRDLCNNDLIEETTGGTESDSIGGNSKHEGSFSPESPLINQELMDSTKRSPDSNNEEYKESAIPKLRLNISLASDPALKPEAKDIKIIHSESFDENIKKNEIDDNIIPRANIKSPNIEISHRVKIFMCHPCNIGFSSLSTLEAHQTYYCSYRKESEDDKNTNSISITDKECSGEPSVKSLKTGKQYACTQCSYSADKKVSLNRHMRMHQTSPALSSNASNGDDSSSQQIDRYCSECDIRFSNVKTYRAHKQHYCNSRRTDRQNTTPKPDAKKSGSISPRERSKTPTAIIPPQPFLALPTNPILIIPYSLVRAASLLPGPLTSVASGTSNPETTCFSFENGSLNAIATLLPTQTVTDTTNQKSTSHNSTVTPPLLTEKNSKLVNNSNIVKNGKREGSSRDTTPLDLSIRKSPIPKFRPRSETLSSNISDENRIEIETMMEGKENLLLGSGKMTPEHIVCAPSLPSSPSSSPSPKRRTISPRSGSVPVSPLSVVSEQISLRSMLPNELALKLNEANIIPPIISKQNLELAIRLSSTGNNNLDNPNVINSTLLAIQPTPINIVQQVPNVQPQIYVKQGVSKCKECNIVFCKYENYLAHKQHYCSARNQDDNERKINTPPTHSNQAESGTPPISYHQLICAACGIKYTSLDNLRAHQTFYCPKGGDLANQIGIGKEKCTKCSIIHEIGKQCPVTQGSYKCPVCDVVCLSAIEGRKHLETHGSVKAFRCSICRYKGNTLRGMRTHIRMHFDKKTSDFNEENYMSCILEEDGIEIQSPATINPDTQPQQLYNCDVCNYSSSYKGNVMRHMKLVHVQHSSNNSISPESTEVDPLTQNGELNQIHKPEERVFIKTEIIESKICDKDYTIDKIGGIKIEQDEKRDSDNDLTITNSPPLTSDENSIKATIQKYCQICDIKFNYMNTYLAHKQFYCKGNRNEIDSTSPLSTHSSVLSTKNKENLETVL